MLSLGASLQITTTWDQYASSSFLLLWFLLWNCQTALAMMCHSKGTDWCVSPYLFYCLPPWPTSQLVAFLSWLDWFQVLFPPSVTNADVACDYSSHPIYPFAFRTHTHRLGESQWSRADSVSPSQRIICNGRCSLAQVKWSAATESVMGSGAWLGDSPPSCHRYAKEPMKDFDLCWQHAAIGAAIHGLVSALSKACTVDTFCYALQLDGVNYPKLKFLIHGVSYNTRVLVFLPRPSTLQPRVWLLETETPWQPDVSSLVKAEPQRFILGEDSTLRPAGHW